MVEDMRLGGTYAEFYRRPVLGHIIGLHRQDRLINQFPAISGYLTCLYIPANAPYAFSNIPRQAL